MTIEQVKIYKERAFKIKSLLDEFFVDLQGGEYAGVSTPLHNMAKQNLRLMNHLNNLLSKWEPADMPLEKVHLKLIMDKAWTAYAECRSVSSHSKEYNISVSEKIQKILEKTTDSLLNVHDYFEAKDEQ